MKPKKVYESHYGRRIFVCKDSNNQWVLVDTDGNAYAKGHNGIDTPDEKIDEFVARGDFYIGN